MSREEVKITKRTEGVTLTNEAVMELIAGINYMTESVADGKLTMPPKIAYVLMKNQAKFKSVSNLQKQLLEKLNEKVKKAHPTDDVKYSKDKDYAGAMNTLYRSLIINDKLYEEFKKDTVTVELYTISLSEEKLKEIDPDSLFDPSFIPIALIDSVFLF